LIGKAQSIYLLISYNHLAVVWASAQYQVFVPFDLICFPTHLSLMTASQLCFCAYNLIIEHIYYKKKRGNFEESQHYITKRQAKRGVKSRGTRGKGLTKWNAVMMRYDVVGEQAGQIE
jgi:hypothetical protein